VGLDIYVGPLTRYYAGDWETVIQKAGRESGVPVIISRPPGGFPPLQVAHEVVLAWRTRLERAMVGLTKDPLDWAEFPDGEYATDKPDFEGIEAVRLLAAQQEFPSVSLPIRAGRGAASSHLLDLVKDRYSGGGFKRFRKLLGRPQPAVAVGPYEHLHFAQMWLPIDLETTLETTDVGSRSVRIGSVPRLRRELARLNEQTFDGDQNMLDAWRREGPPDDHEFRNAARFGLAVWLQLAIEADEGRQPMILDW
jgi:hypothetical protein